jgi:hypothetical protein
MLSHRLGGYQQGKNYPVRGVGRQRQRAKEAREVFNALSLPL